MRRQTQKRDRLPERGRGPRPRRGLIGAKARDRHASAVAARRNRVGLTCARCHKKREIGHEMCWYCERGLARPRPPVWAFTKGKKSKGRAKPKASSIMDLDLSARFEALMNGHGLRVKD